jgi:hypothetical protein
MARELRHRYTHVRDLLIDLQRIAQNLDPLGPHPRAGLHGSNPEAGTAPPARRLRTNPGTTVLLLALATVSLLALGFVAALHPPSPATHASPASPPHTAPMEPGTSNGKVPLVVDFHQDQRMEFLMVLPGSPGQPGDRLCCLDYETARLLWQQPLHGNASNLRLLHHSNPAQSRILVTVLPHAPPHQVHTLTFGPGGNLIPEPGRPPE